MPTQSDVQFAQAAVKLKLLTVEKAKEALQSLKVAEGAGAKVPISQIMLNKGLLAKEQIAQIKAALGEEEAEQKKITRLGPYRLLSKIGQGGTGEIVLCVDRDIRRPIAITSCSSWLLKQHRQFI